jgi:hypothetical protein
MLYYNVVSQQFTMKLKKLFLKNTVLPEFKLKEC